ncbi:MAG: A/G-specific adenine glycosylase [Opitutaceae bacterium]
MSLLSKKKAFQQALNEWYRTAQRPLPWRTEPSIYRTVVSELMAQQTQIKTMLPYFERWMQRFPNFAALAKASPEDVLKHWEGLGYYSRARNLHKLAQVYISMETKPVTAKEWQALPGIGPYTASAVSSICHNQPAAVVDGNVVRILTRLTNDTRTFKNNGDAVKAVTELAQSVLNDKDPGHHNQAMMELGATICTKHSPSCATCPVSSLCQGFAQGAPTTIPKIQRKATEHVAVTRLWIAHKDRLLLHQNSPDAKQLAGQYELPTAEQLDIKTPKSKPLLSKTRAITHRRIKESIHQVNTTEKLLDNISRSTDLHWTPIEALDRITLSGPHRRWVKEILTQT